MIRISFDNVLNERRIVRNMETVVGKEIVDNYWVRKSRKKRCLRGFLWGLFRIPSGIVQCASISITYLNFCRNSENFIKICRELPLVSSASYGWVSWDFLKIFKDLTYFSYKSIRCFQKSIGFSRRSKFFLGFSKVFTKYLQFFHSFPVLRNLWKDFLRFSKTYLSQYVFFFFLSQNWSSERGPIQNRPNCNVEPLSKKEDMWLWVWGRDYDHRSTASSDCQGDSNDVCRCQWCPSKFSQSARLAAAIVSNDVR